MRVRSLLLSSSVVLAVACAGVETPRRPAESEAPLRLSRSVIPLRYDLDLEIDPSQDRFRGTARIDVDLVEPASTLVLHAVDLEFDAVHVERAGLPIPVATRSGANGTRLLEMAAPLAEGEATILLSWSAPLGESPHGLYRVEERGRWYAFTQFEPLEARKAFPSFDQPEFKTPFAVTLRVPRGELALANAPLLERRIDGEHDVFVFAETEPLPTYLVAFAVGGFEVVPVETPDGSPVNPPIRIVSVEGKGALADFAAERTPLFLEWLSDYFAHPFPFAKLDMIAVPNFSAGAMENVGLVTFRERLLLLDQAEASVWDRRWSQTVIAHELAHMWFGNLVTMKWWDALWLNESFATWMADKAMADIDPGMDVGLDAVSHAQHIMYLDSKRDARRIHQPIESEGDVYNAFDGITYGKGGAVLRMLEAWIGEEDFREGVRAYMLAHAYGSGGTEELLASLESASGLPVAETARPFLDQAGTPLVDVQLHCEDTETSPRLILRQNRYLPLGSGAEAGGSWRVPVCVAYASESGEGGRGRECFVLDAKKAKVTLDGATGCPDWLHPNANERGYYRWSLPPERLVGLAGRHRAKLTAAERVALQGHFAALVESGHLPVGDYARALELLAQDPHPKVVQTVSGALHWLYDKLVDDDMEEAFSAYVRELLGPSLDRIGLLPRADEPATDRMLRSSLVRSMAMLGRAEAVLQHARGVADRFLERPDSVSEEVLGLFLPLALRDADSTQWQALLDSIPEATTPAIRGTLIQALGSVRDPELLARSLDLVLDGTLRGQDYRSLAGSIAPRDKAVAWRWLTRHYAEVAALVGPMSAGKIPMMASALCSDDAHREVEQFFASLPDPPDGTDRNARLALEDVERCSRLRDREREPLRAFLQDRKSAVNVVSRD